MIMVLIFVVMCCIFEGLVEMQVGCWEGWLFIVYLGGCVGGWCLGILGMGWIGQVVVWCVYVFGMQVYYYNCCCLCLEIEVDLYVIYWESLDQMLVWMDIISVNVLYMFLIFYLLNVWWLKLLKFLVVVVNILCGEVIDENVLIWMLCVGEIVGVGFDVFEYGYEINFCLCELLNVVLLLYMGSVMVEGWIEMGEKVLINIKIFVDGYCLFDLVVFLMFQVWLGCVGVVFLCLIDQ